MSGLKVSVAMATRNGMPFVLDQVKSIIYQRRRPDEVIVSDDASTDGTVSAIMEILSGSDIKLKVIVNDKPLGVNRNFSQALAHSDGDIVFICDQDDIWYPGKIDRVVAFIAESGALSVTNDQRICDAEMKPVGATKLRNIRTMSSALQSFHTGCCTAIKRTLLDVTLPIPDKIPYDIWIGRIALFLDKKVILAEVLQDYRRHGNNASNWIASEQKVGLVDSIKVAGESVKLDIVSLWHAQVKDLCLFADRINDCRADNRLADSEAAYAIRRIRERESAIRARIEIVRRRGLARIKLILRLLLTGGYEEFSGVKSAFKDLVRPKLMDGV